MSDAKQRQTQVIRTGKRTVIPRYYAMFNKSVTYVECSELNFCWVKMCLIVIFYFVRNNSVLRTILCICNFGNNFHDNL
jgi:hypothetical protein